MDTGGSAVTSGPSIVTPSTPKVAYFSAYVPAVSGLLHAEHGGVFRLHVRDDRLHALLQREAMEANRLRAGLELHFDLRRGDVHSLRHTGSSLHRRVEQVSIGDAATGGARDAAIGRPSAESREEIGHPVVAERPPRNRRAVGRDELRPRPARADGGREDPEPRRHRARARTPGRRVEVELIGPRAEIDLPPPVIRGAEELFIREPAIAGSAALECLFPGERAGIELVAEERAWGTRARWYSARRSGRLRGSPGHSTPDILRAKDHPAPPRANSTPAARYRR